MQIIIQLDSGAQVHTDDLIYIIQGTAVFFNTNSVPLLAGATLKELVAIQKLLIQTTDVLPQQVPVQDTIPGLEAAPTPSFLDAANRGLSGA